jgi:hypothetical protein
VNSRQKDLPVAQLEEPLVLPGLPVLPGLALLVPVQDLILEPGSGQDLVPALDRLLGAALRRDRLGYLLGA